MRFSGRFHSGCLCLALIIFLALACLWPGLTAISAQPAGQDAKPEYGDSLVIGMVAEPSNLLPFIANDAPSHQVAGEFFISLLKYDKNIEITTYAAESYQVLDGGLRLRFVLKKGLLWQDGVELTVDDVEFTYRLMIDPNTPTPYGSDFKAVKEFKKIDRYTFEVFYEKPFARSLLTWMQAIMPKHALEGQDLRNTPLSRRPLSSGPYLMESWKKGLLITLKSNPSYFEGRPYIDRYYFRFVTDPTTMFLELKAGKIDMMGLTPQQYVYQTKSEPFRKNFNVYRSLASIYTYMGYNLKSPLFKDKLVRQAIAYAIDKNELIDIALFGQGVPTIGPYKPETWIYNTNIKDRAHDPAKALELLAQAGWKPRAGDGVLVNSQGHPFAFTLLVDQGNETRIKTAVILQSQLKKVGIDVKIRTVEWAAFISLFVDTGYFDALILGWTIPQDPDGFDVWHSSRSANGGLNFVHFANAEADEILVKARGTFAEAERKVLYDRFQEILHEEQPYCFLYVPYSLTALHKRFRGVEPAPAGIGHNMNEWWVPKAEQMYNAAPQKGAD